MVSTWICPCSVTTTKSSVPLVFWRMKDENLRLFSADALREAAAQRGGMAKPGLERKILSYLLQHDAKHAIAKLKLRAIDFLIPKSCAIFSAIGNLIHLGHEISVENLEDELEKDGKLDLVGGCEFIRHLFYEIDLEPQTPDLLENRVWQQRKTVFVYRASRALSESQAKLALDGEPEATVEVRQKLLELQKECFPDKNEDFWVEDSLIELTEEMESERDDSLYFSTGYPEIDRWTQDGLGWKRGTLCLLLGGSGVGKTWTMMNFARHAVYQGKGVIIFSGEMDARSLMKRLICAELRVPSWKIRQGLKPDQHAHVMDFVGRMSEVPWLISCDRPHDWGEDYFEAKIESFNLKYGKYPDIVFLDHFHKWVGVAGEKARGRYSPAPIEGEYIIILRQLAIKYRHQFVALAQPSKDSSRGGKLSKESIRGSSAIYEEADMAIAINRPDLIDKNAPPDIMEISFIKNREGPTGEDVYLSCEPECYRLG